MKKGTIIRTILGLLAIVNVMLTYLGKNPLPFTEEEISAVVSAVFVIGVFIWNHWKNNSYTAEAIAADEYLNSLRDDIDRGGAEGKTNLGLVAYAKSMVGHPYWYGCFGQKSTLALYRAKKKQYPDQYTWSCPASQLGKLVFDCIGLIKGYLWGADLKSTPKYNPNQDVSANRMLELCKKKGKIATIPEVPGILVFKKGHVGVYIGNGKVIEAMGHAYGVRETKLKDRPFTDWGYCPWIEYITEPKTEDKPTAPAKQTATKQTSSAKYYKKYTGKSGSIVDALKAIGVNSSYANRKKIAKANGIKAYIGSPSQNTKLLALLKQGKLINP